MEDKSGAHKGSGVALEPQLSPDGHCSSVSRAWEERKIIKGFTFPGRDEAPGAQAVLVF